MSHQSGIQPSPELQQLLSKAKHGKTTTRLIKIEIEDESLVSVFTKKSNKSWKTEFDALVQPLLDVNKPCYILYRLDSVSESGSPMWSYLFWSPDEARVRDKMLYASTRATLRKAFGTNLIESELMGNVKHDLSLDSYLEQKKSQLSEAPRSRGEQEMHEMNHSKPHVGIDTKHQTLKGVSFPITEQAQHALHDFSKHKLNYVQLSMDLVNETVLLEKAGEDIQADELPDLIPTQAARYHLYRFDHRHNSELFKPIIFVYSMPGYECSIKERMVYSSFKAPLLEDLIRFKIEIAKKLEISEPNELGSKFFISELHPPEYNPNQRIEKPKGPANRGPRRLIR